MHLQCNYFYQDHLHETKKFKYRKRAIKPLKLSVIFPGFGLNLSTFLAVMRLVNSVPNNPFSNTGIILEALEYILSIKKKIYIYIYIYFVSLSFHVVPPLTPRSD